MAPIAEDPYKVTISDDKTVILKKTDGYVEKISHSRIILAPKPRPDKAMVDVIRPTMAEEKIHGIFHQRRTEHEIHPEKDDEEDKNDGRDHEKAKCKETSLKKRR